MIAHPLRSIGLVAVYFVGCVCAWRVLVRRRRRPTVAEALAIVNKT